MTERYYTDIHAHIISGIDDGAESFEESVHMLQLAYEENIRTIIATPHYGLTNPGYRRADAERRLQALRKIARSTFPGLSLYMGNELFWSPGILEALKAGDAATLAGTDYVLVEFYEDEDAAVIEEAAEKLLWAGYLPVIAHAERYTNIAADIEAARVLIETGAYLQVNCRSIEADAKKPGLFKRRDFIAQRMWQAQEMIRAGVVHFVASDAHSDRRRRPLYERPAEELRKLTGDKPAESIMYANPAKLINNETI